MAPNFYMKRFQLMSSAAALLLGVVMVGCNASDEQVDVVPEAVKLEGTVQPALVGVWKSADGTSTLTLKEDGSSITETKVNVRGTEQNNKAEGQWRASDTDVRFERQDAGGASSVIKYQYRLPTPKSLELDILGGKKKIIYAKK
jgi:hypothetical protein